MQPTEAPGADGGHVERSLADSDPVVLRLEETAELLASSLDAFPDPYMHLIPVWTDDGRVQDFVVGAANRAMCRFIRRGSDQMLGMGLLREFPVLREIGLADWLEEVLVSGTAASREAWPLVSPSDGELRRFDLSAVPVGAGLVYTFRDVTDAMRRSGALAESEQRLRAINEATFDPQVLLAPVRDSRGTVVDLRYMEVNRATRAYLGMDREQLVGRLVTDTFPGLAESGLLAEYIRTFVSGEPLVLDAFPYSNEVLGVEAYYDIRAAATDHGVVLSWRDVTAIRKAQEDLAASESRFRLLAENTGDIVALSRDGVYQWLSPSVEQQVGWSPDELVGRLHADFVHPDDLPVVAGTREDIGRGAGARVRYRYRAKDGAYHWLDVAGAPALSPAGEVEGVLASGRIIDEQVEAERRVTDLLRERGRLIEQLPVGVFRVRVHETGFATDFHSARAREILDLPAEEGPDDLARLAAAFGLDGLESVAARMRQSTLTGEPMSWEGPMARRGEQAWIRIAGTLENLESGDLQFDGLIQDITESKQTESLMVAAREQAEVASLAKSTFLANMSHEIRTPLSAVLGLLHLLDESGLDRRQQDYTHRAQQAARSLLNILNDILDYSKIEAGELRVHSSEFALESVLHDLGVVLAAQLGGKDVDLLFDVDPGAPTLLIGDQLRLSQVLLNLSGNALKFTEEGQVTVRARVAARTADSVRLRFEVEDTGIGMTEAEVARVAESFVQADASTERRYGGTGLGLAISRQLIDLLGGELVIDSAPGQGTVCRFELDFEVSAEGMAVGRRNQRRVLLVGGRDQARVVTRRILEGVQCTVDECELEELADADLSGPPACDLVLVDLPLSRQTSSLLGDLRREWQDGGSRPRPQLMAVIAQAQASVAYDAIANGCIDGFIVRPFTGAMLRTEVRRLHVATFPQPTSAAGRGARLEGVRLLLVEDNELNRLVARRSLEAEGAMVHDAQDGRAAVDLITANEQFDAVLMDLQMPVLDGLAATRELRAAGYGELPIIAMTANATVGDREACLEAGMNDHVAKPFEMDGLVASILRWTAGVDPEEDEVDARAQEPLLDLAGALARVDHDRDFLGSMLQRFAARLPEWLRQLDLALLSGDADAVRQLAHTQKGAAATVGAVGIAAAAAEVEAEAKAGGEMTLWDPRIRALRDAVMRTVAELERTMKAGGELA